MKFTVRSIHYRSTCVLALLSAAALSSISCTQNSRKLAAAVTKTSSQNTTENSGTDGASTPQIPGTLDLATRTAEGVPNAANSIDLVGDGSGDFGRNCPDPSSNGGSGPRCVVVASYYDRAQSGGSTTRGAMIETEFTPVLYEINMLRVAVRGGAGAIPETVEEVYLKIRHENGGTTSFSNSIKLSFTQGSSPSDPTLAANFVPVHRFQCYDMPVIMNPLDGKIYDPLRSQDPDLIFPLNFYSSNRAITYKLLAANPILRQSGGRAGWYCPISPADTADFRLSRIASNGQRFGFLADADRLRLAADVRNRIDLRLYSLGIDGNGSYLMYPPKSKSATVPAEDRTRFHLASRSMGVFNVPLIAEVGPAMRSTQTINLAGGVSYKIPPLGYAARPVVDSITGVDRCPNPATDPSAKIPAGFKWVKIWQFRGAIPRRQYADPQRLKNAQGETNVRVLCNPGLIPGDNVNPIFKQCARATDRLADGTSPNSPIANRILAFNTMTDPGRDAFCLRLGAPSAGQNNNSALNACEGTPQRHGAGCSSVNVNTMRPGFAEAGIPPGSDTWEPAPNANNVPSPQLCQDSGDPLKICTRIPGTQQPGVPRDMTIPGATGNPVIVTNLDQNERGDYIYVVTPDSVSRNDMASRQEYSPYRIKRAGTCLFDNLSGLANDPACGVSNRIIYAPFYANLVDDVGKPNEFPLCALQPIGSD